MNIPEEEQRWDVYQQLQVGVEAHRYSGWR